jgi:Tfp pilus assembly protein PilV
MRHTRAAMTGSSLLEVAIALLLLAGATVGALGTQLAMRHVEADLAMRAQAWRLVDSRAELARSASVATVDWAHAAPGLPGVRFDEATRDGHALVSVFWRRRGHGAASRVCDQRANGTREPAACVALAYSAGVSP